MKGLKLVIVAMTLINATIFLQSCTSTKTRMYSLYLTHSMVNIEVQQSGKATAFLEGTGDTLIVGSLHKVLTYMGKYTADDSRYAEEAYEEMASHVLDSVDYQALLRGRGFAYRKY